SSEHYQDEGAHSEDSARSCQCANPKPISRSAKGTRSYMNLPVPTAFRNAPPQSIDSNNIYDFGSILRMIEGIYGARGITEGTLGVADARSNTDLSAFF